MKDKTSIESGSLPNKDNEGISRRDLLKSGPGMLAAGSLLGGSTLLGTSKALASGNSGTRAEDARQKCIDAAEKHYLDTLNLPVQESNNDEDLYAGDRYYASFTKTLRHNKYGEVNPNDYGIYLQAIQSGDPADYDAIPRSNNAERKLANPQGAYRFIFSGLDGHATRMRAAPAFNSAETAAEMGEVYWLALTRDIPFADYGADVSIASAVIDLNNFSEPVGPKVNGLVTPETLFRGSTPGDLVGPYISQFLWKDIPYGPSLIEQRYSVPDAGVNFMTTEQNWRRILRGRNPSEQLVFDPTKRYIYNNRALGEYVHGDVLFQAYFNAALIALSYGPDALDFGNPYKTDITNQGNFTSLGGPWIIDLVSQAGNLALAGAWYQKWLVHRRLRPEVYAGRVHFHTTGERSYDLHSDILNSAAISDVYSGNGTYFLPMAFTEGSPTHPAYPAGHATVAGACTTVLKAVFDEDFVIPNPVVANNTGTALDAYTGGNLTLGGEVNKLANNISLGRDAAGVHYRSDGADGLLVGEQQAIALLEDYSTGLNENFGGFSLTKFDGTSIHIIDGQTVTV